MSHERVSEAHRTEPRVSYAVARLDRAVRREIADLVEPMGLTVPQYTALSVLRARSGLSNAQLARRSYITPQSANELIVALEDKGLVRRNPHPNHGRIRQIELTAKGARVLAACDELMDDMEENMLSELSAKERERFLGTLTTCVHTLGAGL